MSEDWKHGRGFGANWKEYIKVDRNQECSNKAFFMHTIERIAEAFEIYIGIVNVYNLIGIVIEIYTGNVNVLKGNKRSL